MLVMLVAVNSVVSPKISKMSKNEEYNDIEKLLRFSSLCTFLPALFIGCILFVYGESMLLLLYGDEYVSAVSVLYVICLTHVVNSYFGPVMVAMNMLGRESISLYAVVVSLLVTCTLGELMVTKHGALGVAIAVLVGVFIWNTILAVGLYRIYGINCIPKLTAKL